MSKSKKPKAAVKKVFVVSLIHGIVTLSDGVRSWTVPWDTPYTKIQEKEIEELSRPECPTQEELMLERITLFNATRRM